MDKYKNKYRIKSARLPNWDYGRNARYFVTICTHKRIHFFGKIEGGIMDLSDIGKLAEKYWHEIPDHFPFVKLDAFVVMPNHVHGIIIIDKPIENNDVIVDDGMGNGYIDDGYVETQNFASLQPSTSQQPPTSQQQQQQPTSPSSIQPQPSFKNKFGPQSKNLASIIRGYKIGVTKNAIPIDPLWKWQPRYHDHIIRNGASFQRIKTYIMNNPKNWNEDKFYE